MSGKTSRSAELGKIHTQTSRIGFGESQFIMGLWGGYGRTKVSQLIQFSTSFSTDSHSDLDLV